eukprot:26171-Rhodomonas_salina.1
MHAGGRSTPQVSDILRPIPTRSGRPCPTPRLRARNCPGTSKVCRTVLLECTSSTRPSRGPTAG